MNGLVAPAAVEMGIISWRTLSGERLTLTKSGIQTGTGPKRPPLPSEIVAVVVVFGAFSVVAGDSSNPQRALIGSMLGWGIVLATFLNMFGSNTKQTSANVSAAPGTTLA